MSSVKHISVFTIGACAVALTVGLVLMTVLVATGSFRYRKMKLVIQTGSASKMYDGTKLEVFDRLADPELKNDLAESDAKAYQPQLNFLKAIIQQYNNRMIENRLTVEEK